MTTAYADDTPEHRTFTPRTWLSDNDDRAWAEKLYLWYIPVFFAITGFLVPAEITAPYRL